MENAILDTVKNKVKSLKVFSEELQVQMALGKAEAQDLMERERKTLSSYMAKQKGYINSMEKLSEDKRRDLLTIAEDLESALYDEVPTSAKKYDKYKVNLLEKIYRLEESIKENYMNESSEVKIRLAAFKTKMDAFRLNLALHDKDDPEKVAQIRNEFTGKLEDVRKLLAVKEDDHSRLDNFVEDISESFSYLKKALTDLTN